MGSFLVVKKYRVVMVTMELLECSFSLDGRGEKWEIDRSMGHVRKCVSHYVVYSLKREKGRSEY